MIVVNSAKKIFHLPVLQHIDELRLPLINRFYADCNYRVKCGRQDLVYSFTIDGKIIAAARLMPQVSGDLLLRNLCVSPEYRQQGVATQFLSQILQQIPNNCYCFALSHLLNFYSALGFVRLLPTQVPADIGETHIRNCLRKRGWILMGFGHRAITTSETGTETT